MEGGGGGRVRVLNELDAFCQFSSSEKISAELCSNEDGCQRGSFDKKLNLACFVFFCFFPQLLLLQ